MRKTDKQQKPRKDSGSVGMLSQREVQSMLAAFGTMSLHDQAVIYGLIHDRAKANAQPRERGI